MRKTRTLIAAALLAVTLLTGGRAHAQIPTTDVANLAQNITAWVDEVMAAAEQLRSMGISIDISKEKLEHAREIYNKVGSYIKDGREMYEIYRATQRAYDSYGYLMEYVEMCRESRMLTAGQVGAVRRQATYLYHQVTDIAEMVQQFLDPKNPLPQEARIRLLSEKKDEIDAVGRTFEDQLREDMRRQSLSCLSTGADIVVANAIGMPTPLDGMEARTAFSEDDPAVEDYIAETRRRLDGKDAFDPQEGATGNAVVDNVFGFTTAVIGIVAVMLLVWAFARRGKDPQHDDVLWKWFVGLLFALLLLQLIKVCVFDSGFFTMTIMNF